jgi:hypothetical protein
LPGSISAMSADEAPSNLASARSGNQRRHRQKSCHVI